MNNIYIELEKIPELFNEASHIAYEDIQKFFENDFSEELGDLLTDTGDRYRRTHFTFFSSIFCKWRNEEEMDYQRW